MWFLGLSKLDGGYGTCGKRATERLLHLDDEAFAVGALNHNYKEGAAFSLVGNGQMLRDLHKLFAGMRWRRR